MHFRTIAGITITPNRVRHYLLFLFLEMTKKRCSRRQPPPSSGEQEKVTLDQGAHLPCRCTPFTVADDEIPERGDSNEDLLLNEKKKETFRSRINRYRIFKCVLAKQIRLSNP
jgi:hypothetical protein